MRYLKPVAAALALSLSALTVADSADARDRDRRHHHRHHGGNVAAAGVVGLAAGAVIGSALAQPRYVQPAPVYVEQPPVYYRTQPVYTAAPVYAPEPWTPAWYRYCSAKYRSFDPQSGTYIAYGGAERFCQ